MGCYILVLLMCGGVCMGLCLCFGVLYPLAVILWEKVIRRSDKPVREILEDC